MADTCPFGPGGTVWRGGAGGGGGGGGGGRGGRGGAAGGGVRPAVRSPWTLPGCQRVSTGASWMDVNGDAGGIGGADRGLRCPRRPVGPEAQPGGGERDH